MRRTGCIAGLIAAVALAMPALGIDAEHEAKARGLITKSIAFLRAQQDAQTGGWSVRAQGPTFPAITALVVNGMVMEPGIDERDPTVARGVSFILNYRQPDGGIYDRVLPSYNTAICLSALARVKTPEAAAAILPAQNFLRSIQWSESTAASPDSPPDAATGLKIDKSHPFYGGVGYGNGSRPDLSNLHFMLQGLHDSGVAGEDIAFQRALVFLSRVQMHEQVNDMPYAKGSHQGGFVYATSAGKDTIGQGESKGATIEETMDDGAKVSRLRAYGSMTYAGFKSYIYAELKRDDPRVTLAFDWIRRNYALDRNPGMPAGAEKQGLYYYYLTFARALDAWGETTIATIPSTDPGAARIVEMRDWANDLIDQLALLQKEDGSFENTADRWMEGDPALVTAYALLALEHAVR